MFEHSGVEKSKRSVLGCGIFIGKEICRTLIEVLRRGMTVLLADIVSVATTADCYLLMGNCTGKLFACYMDYN